MTDTWAQLVAEYEPLIDRTFRADKGDRPYVFFGLVHASDDYYFGMLAIDDGPRQLRLLSCVGDLESHGYTLLEDDDA